MVKQQEEKYNGWLVSPSFGKRVLAFTGYNLLATLLIWSVIFIAVMITIFVFGVEF